LVEAWLETLTALNIQIRHEDMQADHLVGSCADNAASARITACRKSSLSKGFKT